MLVLSGARAVAREAARWSADPANVERYLTAGRRMEDLLGLSNAQVRLSQAVPTR